MKQLIIAIALLLMSSSAMAGKVDICHFSDTQVLLKSVSENALDNHLAHGDVLASDYETCELPLIPFCLELHYYEGLGYGEFTQYLPVNYYPSTGEVYGLWFDGPNELSGNIMPIGSPEYSIFSAGATFRFYSPVQEESGWDWIGAGVSYDASGTFVGFWAGAPGTSGENYEQGAAPTDYAFLDGQGNCPPAPLY